MRLLFKLFAILVVLVGVLAIAGLFLDPAWEVSRSVVIEAPADAIHPWIADLRRWPAWSPFEAEDPDMVSVHTGAERGVGARRDWTSEIVGNGWMEITAADPARGVWFDLQMQDMPAFKGIFQYEPADGGTRVSWTDRGDMGGNVIFRWFGIAMDTMLGPKFEQGLATLKQQVEQT